MAGCVGTGYSAPKVFDCSGPDKRAQKKFGSCGERLICLEERRNKLESAVIVYSKCLCEIKYGIVTERFPVEAKWVRDK